MAVPSTASKPVSRGLRGNTAVLVVRAEGKGEKGGRGWKKGRRIEKEASMLFQCTSPFKVG